MSDIIYIKIYIKVKTEPKKQSDFNKIYILVSSFQFNINEGNSRKRKDKKNIFILIKII